ncbi:HAD-IIIC family phosphatase [Actinosynnema sp. NPDC053489]|uniref:HAD-IIIC family phosphatase n=1 Tax=Actinosynnema sp. NPDC053489 TaxID=3363916 RepID=UPI0037C8DF3A
MTVVKCLVWDLDDTLWDGVVLEGDRPVPRPEAVAALEALDGRGILHAVASRGDRGVALAHLAELGLDRMFCALEVGWGAKSESVRRIAAGLNIALDDVAFTDNDAVERAEVAAALPRVRCYPAEQVGALPSLPEFQPGVVTPEARRRRESYLTERRRVEAEERFDGSAARFLASLDLELTVATATEADLERARELTVRTHQLNTTGVTFDVAELRALCASPGHEVLVARLRDRFGDYGTIGLAVVAHEGRDAVLELLLMSCRVMSRGVGAVLLGDVVRDAVARGRRPVARFVRTPVNKVMLVTLRFAGFEVVEQDGDRLLLARPSPEPPTAPGHVRVVDARRR